MKLKLFNGLVLMFLFSTQFAAFSQNDTVTEKAIKYAQPEVAQAELSMLTPPEGFVVSESFNGYIHYQASSAIIMTLVMDASYLNIMKGMTEEFFEKNKLTKISDSKIVTDNGTKGISYKFSFDLSGQEFIRYMVYVGDLNQTLWLNITYPKHVEELVEGEILRSIQTINLKPNRDEE